MATNNNIINVRAHTYSDVVVSGSDNNIGAGCTNIIVMGDRNTIDPGLSNVFILGTSDLTITTSNVVYIAGKKIDFDTTTDGQLLKYVSATETWGPGTGEGGSGTNLSYTPSPTNGVVLSDTGTDATVLLVDATNAGLMSPSDFIKLNGITSSTSELNILDGATITTTELNYVDGVTSSIQTQLDGKLNKSSVPCEFIIACSDETTAITVGTGKATFRVPYAFTLTSVKSCVTTAPTGSTIIIDINENGSSILSTKLSIDASEKTSTTATTAAVISDSSIADDAEITIDFDQVGSTIAGTGIKVTLIGTRSV